MDIFYVSRRSVDIMVWLQRSFQHTGISREYKHGVWGKTQHAVNRFFPLLMVRKNSGVFYGKARRILSAQWYILES